MTSLHSELRSATKAFSQEALITRVRGEFLEMPGLRLAPAQAARAVDRDTCDRVLQALVNMGFLWQTRDGSFLRVTVS